MVGENIVQSAGNVTLDLMESLQPIIASQLAPLMTIFKAIGIAVLVYVLFLIVRGVFRWRSTSKIIKISKDVSEINQKLDILIGSKKSKNTEQDVLISSRKSKSVEPEKDKTIKGKKEKKK